MITAKTNVKEAIGDIRKLRRLLGISAEQQGRELAGSCCYVAARLSYPQTPGTSGGGAKLPASVGKKQEGRIEGAVFAYTQIRKRKNKATESASQLVQNHPSRVRIGYRIQSNKRIEMAASHRAPVLTTVNARKRAAAEIAQRAGWNKAAWVAASKSVNPKGKQSVPAYIQRHVEKGKGKHTASEMNGTWTFVMTNTSGSADSIFDRGEYGPAIIAASQGQAKRYELRIRKMIKEARLA